MRKKIFCDIDNTIADHYSHYIDCLKKNKKINLLDLKPIKNSQTFFKFFSKNYDIYFITRRKKEEKKNTISWLKKNNFIFKKVIFIKNDISKLNFIISNNGFIYIDDLKYNYENKKPKIKTKLIRKIKLKKITFFRFNSNWVELKKKISKLKF